MRLSVPGLAALLGATLLVSGCPDPGLTENPLGTPDSGPPVVSVCYPPLVTDRAEIDGVALAGCEEAGIERPELAYWKRTVIFNDCPLFKKVRAAYECRPGADAKPPAPQLPITPPAAGQ